MKKLSLMALAVCGALFAGQAQAYKYQIDLDYQHYDWDDANLDQGAFGLTGTAYFDPVDVKNYPLQEAAFLSQSKNLYAAYAYNYIDYTQGTDETNLDINHFMGGFEYFNRTSGLYVNAQLGRSTLNQEIFELNEKVDEGETNVTHYLAEVGFMPNNHLLFAAGVTGAKGNGEHDTGLSLRTKYVMPVNDSQFVNLEASGQFDDTDTINLYADFYFDPTWSVGAGYSMEDDGENDADFISVRTKKYFNPQLAIGAEIGFGDDLLIAGLTGTYRF